MTRLLTTLVASLAVAGIVGASQDRPAPKKADVVKELERDFEEARTRLEKADPGAQTHAAQRRIIDGIDKLLDDDDPPTNPPPKSSNPPPPGSRPMQTPPASKPSTPPSGNDAAPQPKPGAGDPMKKPSPFGGDLTPEQNRGKRPDLDKDGPWHPLLPTRRAGTDALPRDRFSPQYEELLQAYFRALAVRDRD